MKQNGNSTEFLQSLLMSAKPCEELMKSCLKEVLEGRELQEE